MKSGSRTDTQAASRRIAFAALFLAQVSRGWRHSRANAESFREDGS
jgi:hypothetical protein